MAASSSVASDIFAVLAFISISLLVLLLLRHYLPLRSTPAYLLLPVFLALALPCSIIILVPIDLASVSDSGDQPSRGVWLPERVLLVTWRVTYWLTFVLTWFILPLLGEFSDSGHREVKDRIIYSLRSNARYQLITLCVGIVGLVYFVLQNGFDGESIKGMLMALAYTWGLILAIGLMGHGMVALPRRLFRNAYPAARLQNLQSQAPKIKDKLDEATDELEELESVVYQLKERKYGGDKDIREWIDELYDSTALSGLGRNVRPIPTTMPIPAVATERYMADLSRRLKRARHKKARFVDEWSNLCDQAQRGQAIIDSASNKSLPAVRRIDTWYGRWSVLTPTMRYHLYTNVIPALRIVLSVVFAASSLMIVWSEVVKSFGLETSISAIGLTVVHHPNSDIAKVGIGGQILAALWLLYMDACAIYAIADVKVWGNRALVRRKTYDESACWYAMQLAKLTVPLSYNFITMLPENVYQKTTFYHFLGKLIVLTPLGKGFSRFFPCFIIIPVLFSIFNVYGKLQKFIGVGLLEDDVEGDSRGPRGGRWREGKALIERELMSRGENGGVSGSGTVGLATRGPSLDAERQLSGPSIPRPEYRPGIRAMDAQRAVEAQPPQSGRRIQPEPEDDSARHFYQDFGERIRNTFESVERPAWLSFQKPKWMQNDSSSSNGGGDSAITRLFGGRSEDRRVMLP